ncbi:MAG: glycoside hydrolase family 92 protein, partial [Opitutales bacterium]|nr:glycoside hydrolase family 92 protein [Opitutales bacterium]
MKRAFFIYAIFALAPLGAGANEDYTKYVNVYMGNISHTLVPSLSTIQLPHSMLRVYPKRQDFAAWAVEDFSLMCPSHRAIFPGNGILPFCGEVPPELSTLDNEQISPYSYKAILDMQQIGVEFAPSHRSAVYVFDFSKSDGGERKIRVRVDDGKIFFDKKSGAFNLRQNLSRDGATKMYISLFFDAAPKQVGIVPFSRKPEPNPIMPPAKPFVPKDGADAILSFGGGAEKICVKYGVSFIDFEAAQNNLAREISGFDIEKLKKDGRKIWNEALSKIKVKTSDESLKRVFYTSFWRTFERMIDFGEYGRYYSAYDKSVHASDKPFYCDDWIW